MKDWKELIQKSDEQMDKEIQSMIEEADAQSMKVDQLGYTGMGTKRKPRVSRVYSFKYSN